MPVELTGGSAFPPIGELPYLLTLPAYGFYWFQLSAARTPGSRSARSREPPELFTLVLTGGIETLLAGRERDAFERTVVPRFIATPALVRRQGLAHRARAGHRLRGA